MKLKLSIVSANVLLAVNAVSAEPALDVAQPLICAATEVMECVRQVDCTRGSPDRFNLPVLFKVDIPNKVVESARVGGEKRVSTIGQVTEANGTNVLQGADGAAGWSATINHTDGSMTIASVREGVAYVVFGTCTGL